MKPRSRPLSLGDLPLTACARSLPELQVRIMGTTEACIVRVTGEMLGERILAYGTSKRTPQDSPDLKTGALLAFGRAMRKAGARLLGRGQERVRRADAEKGKAALHKHWKEREVPQMGAHEAGRTAALHKMQEMVAARGAKHKPGSVDVRASLYVPVPGPCIWCGKVVQHRGGEPGDACWCTLDGDYGCEMAPQSLAAAQGWHARPSDPHIRAANVTRRALEELTNIVIEREQGNHDLDEELDAAEKALEAATGRRTL